MKSIIVIPTYNEKDNIIRIIEAVFNVKSDIHILVVDDNSPDGTAGLVENLMKDNNQIHLLKRAGKMGLGTAYCDGFRYCLKKDYDYVFEMDADFSHDPKEIPNFLEAIKENDLVLGSRYIRGVNVVNWPLKRLLLSYFANVYTRFVTGLDVRDATGGFKCFRADMLRKIDLDLIKTNGYGFQMEMTFRVWKQGGRIKEIPIIFVDRMEGESKMNNDIVWEAVFLVWKLKFGLVKGLKPKK